MVIIYKPPAYFNPFTMRQANQSRFLKGSFPIARIIAIYRLLATFLTFFATRPFIPKIPSFYPW